jgi:hypothetical protein
MFFSKKLKLIALSFCLLAVLIERCAPAINSGKISDKGSTGTAPTLAPIFSVPAENGKPTSMPTRTPTAAPSPTAEIEMANEIIVHVNASQNMQPISQMIYGLSGAPIEVLEDLSPGLASWGGNPSTRFNWKLGNAWNAGSDWFYRNGNYDFLVGSASDQFASEVTELAIAGRLAVPALGWVAKDTNNDTCSFPQPDGTCGDANKANCKNPWPIADPNTANVPSTPDTIAAWMRHLFIDKKFDIRFVAIDNEPELWGFTHYDVHPTCTPYSEILRKHLEYTQAIHAVVPEVELVGPVTCCWFYYWNSSAGETDKFLNGNQDFLPWFLENVRKNDESTGWRSLHVLDIHYYPEGVYNDLVNEEISALRLRSTRSRWDAEYVDESWINEPVRLIPRMKELIEGHYPETKLGISEWNWGADETINGALAIADVLGIFGREDLYYAAYWRYPAENSPGYMAFKMYRNYNGEGGAFGDISVTAESNNYDVVSSYASIDSETGNLHLILVNKNPENAVPIKVMLEKFSPKNLAERYQYSSAESKSIKKTFISVTPDLFEIEVPGYSITHLVLTPQQ